MADIGFREWLDETLHSFDPLKALLSVAHARTPVRIQIEKTLIRFKSQVTVGQNGAVMLQKPYGLDSQLSIGSTVRLRMPGPGKYEMRMEVTDPHLNMANGISAFLCKPLQDLASCRRKGERFDATSYSNIRFVLNGETFLLMDLSSKGFKVLLVGTQGLHQLPLGQEIRAGRLTLGMGAHVDLLRVIPRNHQRRMVGCEMEVCGDRRSQGYYRALLKAMHRSDDSRWETIREVHPKSWTEVLGLQPESWGG